MERSIVGESYDRISSLNRLRISTLESLDRSTSNEQKESKLSTADQQGMVDLMENIKKLITVYNFLFKDYQLAFNHKRKFDDLTAWHFVFKTSDFLVKNEFIPQEHYGSIYEEMKFLDEVDYFITDIIKLQNIKKGFPSVHSFYITTENYVWTHVGYFSGKCWFSPSFCSANYWSK
jgi:hypothetical protein